jgi:hypothetical protein
VSPPDGRRGRPLDRSAPSTELAAVSVAPPADIDAAVADIDANPRLAILVRRPGGGPDSIFLSLEPARQALVDAEKHGIRTELILVRLVPLVADLSDFDEVAE